MNIKTILILTAILFLAAFLRFYRLFEMAPFDFDQEYAANFAYNVLRVYPIQLIGQGLSVQGLFMGPLYFYYLVPFFMFTNLNPIGGVIGSVILGLFTIVVYFVIARQMFGTTAGLIAAFLRGILYSNINTDWTMVPAFSCDSLVLITWYCFYRYWHKDDRFIPLLGLVFGLYTSIHPILFPFYFVFLIIVIIRRHLPKIKIIFLGFVAFIIPIIPLIIFESLHNFLELKMLFTLSSGKEIAEPRNWERLTYHTQIILSDFYNKLGISVLSKEVFLTFFFITVIFLFIKKVGFWKDNFHFITLIITFVVFIIYYTLFPTHVPEYYFLALEVLFTFYFCAILSLLAKKSITKIILTLVLIIIVFSNLSLLQKRWQAPSPTSLYQKEFIVKEIIKRVPANQEFYVSYIKLPGWNFGFDYLFKYHGRIPQTKEAKPPVFTIVIPKFLSEQSVNISAGNVGLILPNNQ